jgi:hypothetical protein
MSVASDPHGGQVNAAPRQAWTCCRTYDVPPDAFNSKQNLLQLEPGLSYEVSWNIFSLPVPSY